MRGLLISALLALPSMAVAQDGGVMDLGGHHIEVNDGTAGGKMLFVDGALMLTGGVIWLQPGGAVVAGQTVVMGVAGAGGNACNAAPFVLTLGDAPQVSGPVDSCANLEPQVQADAIIYRAEPLPSQPGEVWVWTPVAGFTTAEPEEFAATAGWDALDGLAGAHPADALAIAPVLAALQAGLGPDFATFAERMSGLGSGDLTPTGYLGQACLKLTCESDFAVLYLHKATRQVFAIWHVYGAFENRIWPEDTTLWPPEAMAVLRANAGE